MIKTVLTLEEVIAFLNSVVVLDPDAMRALIEARVPCNSDIAKHPSIQVSKTDDGYSFGLLGLLNGLFGSDKKGWGTVAATFEVKCLSCGAVSADATIYDKCPKCGENYRNYPFNKASYNVSHF